MRLSLPTVLRPTGFSGGPSRASDRLDTTRGTVSQTLMPMAECGQLVQTAPPCRALSVVRFERLASALADLQGGRAAAMAEPFAALLAALIARQHRRAFGPFRTGRHHERVSDQVARCALLSVPIAAKEVWQICAEHPA